MIDSAKRERDKTKKNELTNEAAIRDQRVRQAKEKVERIQKWEPVPATPAPQAKEPKIKEETRKQVQSEAKEEQEKQKAMEDLLRKPPTDKKKDKDSQSKEK